jgi:hypothetical protein
MRDDSRLCSTNLAGPLVALFLLAACASTPAEPAGGPRGAGSSSAPDWHAQALSWQKLQRIEGWLAGPAPAHWPEAVPEAEVELAEGRLELARRDRHSLPRSILTARLDLAEAGFHRALDHRDIGTYQRGRAEDGLRALGRFRSDLERDVASAPPTGGLPSIRPRSSWGAARPAGSKLRRNQTGWSRITVHHTTTSTAGLGGASSVGTQAALRRIQKMHMEEQGWGDIGYHFLIDPAGRLYQGRDIAFQGAHAGGTANVGNIGICLFGNFETEEPDPRALATLRELVRALSTRHGIARSAVKGHRDYRATDCPGRNLMTWVRSYAAGAGS